MLPSHGVVLFSHAHGGAGNWILIGGKVTFLIIVSVTVISDKCIDTDALSTSLKVIGKEDGLKLVNSLKQTECMFILKENGVLKDYYSNGFSNFLLD